MRILALLFMLVVFAAGCGGNEMQGNHAPAGAATPDAVVALPGGGGGRCFKFVDRF